MQKLTRKTKELVEATLIIGISRGTYEMALGYDEKKERIRQHINGITSRQNKITKETCIDFISWYSASFDAVNMSYDDAFVAFEKQYTEKCNGDCGMNYCDENGCAERDRHLTGTIAPRPEINEDNHF